MSESILYYFTDAVLRAPTIGCMLMCFAAALVGVIVFLRKQSLLGESLSHAAYPGVIIGVLFAGILSLNEEQETSLAILIMFGAFLSTIAGLWAINFLERRLNVRSDSALCFVLSAFFGIGLTLASEVQFSYSTLYRQVQVYLYGQAATMTDVYIVIYGALSIIVLLVVIFFYKEIQAISFDRNYAQSLGINTKGIDAIIFILIVFAVVIGIRSVGVVLMSAMLIAPAAAARQFTNKLYLMFALAGFFGLLSGFFGNYFSVEWTNSLAIMYPTAKLTLPTGPMIVMVASFICLISLLFAPNRGLMLRLARIGRFRYKCVCENVLKAIWRQDVNGEVAFEAIAKYQSSSSLYLRCILLSLAHQGWVDHSSSGFYQLTPEGRLWAARIVRLHRLWEVYLVDYLGVGAERVHRNAEEMEHIITPELERELTLLLKDPKQDPHQQPIPPKEL
ncbi:MAG: metal ABC transporter permease [Parachlamydiaceae bacterium]|nr:metal ABC transporter permease [Parachlamydiaceae bacterium]